LFIFICTFVYFFGKNNHFRNHTHFTNLIKDTVLGRVLWEC